MRILFVVENFPLPSDGVFEITGGVEAAVLAAARWLARSHTVTVLTNLRQPPMESAAEGIQVIQCGSEGRYTQTGGFRQRATFQRKAAERGMSLNPDVVVGWNFISYPPACRIARRCGVPSVAWYADVWVGRWLRLFGLAGLMGEILERRVLRGRWDRFVAISDFTQEKLIERGIAPERVVLIPPIVATGTADVCAAASRDNGESVIVVARMVGYKRVDVAVRAVARLAKQHPALRLTVIGHGPERGALERLAAELGIADRVRWLGWLRAHKDVLAAMAEHSLYLTASEVEGFGITAIEAASVGLPYVAADIPAVRFATRNGEGGLLFAPGDDRGCAEALDRLLADRALYEHKTSEGRRLIGYYSPETVGKQLEDLLVSLAGER
jgi:glycosyltransferase involved in cell wall biosynthesis